MNRYKNISKLTQIFYYAGRKYVVDPEDVVVVPAEVGSKYGFLKNIGTVSTPEVVAKKKAVKE